MSSRGQVVIPVETRAGFDKDEKIVVIRAGKQIILEKTADFQANIVGDIAFAKRVEKAWKKRDKKEFVKKDHAQFLKELETW